MKNGQKKEMVSFAMVFSYWLETLYSKNGVFNQSFDATGYTDYSGHFYNQFSLVESRKIEEFYEDDEHYPIGKYQLDDIFRVKIRACACWGYEVTLTYGGVHVLNFYLDEGVICRPHVEGSVESPFFQKWIDDEEVGEKFMELMFSSSIIEEKEYDRLLRNRSNNPEKSVSEYPLSIELKDGRIIEMRQVDIEVVASESMTILQFIDIDGNELENIWDLLYETDQLLISKLNQELDERNYDRAISAVI